MQHRRLRCASDRALRPGGALSAFAFAVFVFGTLSPRPTPAAAQNASAEQLSEMSFRHIGPVGNRVTSVTGVIGDRFTYYAGAASGGIWKTEDAGLNWRPIFDDYPVHAIGELSVAPSDPNIVWAGTGEPFLRSNVSIGNGVWKSTDAGETWTHRGLDATGRMRLVVVADGARVL